MQTRKHAWAGTGAEMDAREAFGDEEGITGFENMLLALDRQDNAAFQQKYEFMYWIFAFDRLMGRAGPEPCRNLAAARAVVTVRSLDGHGRPWRKCVWAL